MQRNITITKYDHAQLLVRRGQSWLWRGHVIIAMALLVIMLTEPVADAQVRAMQVRAASVADATNLYDQPIHRTATDLSAALLPAQHLKVCLSALHDCHGGTSDVPVHSLLAHQHLAAFLLLVCVAAVLLARRAGCMCSISVLSGFLAPPLAPPKTRMA